MSACNRLRLAAQWVSTNCGHTLIHSHLSQLIPISRIRCNKILTKFIFGNNYAIETPSKKDWNNNKVRLDDNVVCFTDGSRYLTHTGASYYNQSKGKDIFLPLGTLLCLVFQAEIPAILQCAKSNDLRQRHNDSIATCTDSQAALKALSSPKVTSALVLETMAALEELAIFNSVCLLWVHGHYEIPGNEIADELAKQASAQHYIGPEPVLGISSTTIRRSWSQLTKKARIFPEAKAKPKDLTPEAKTKAKNLPPKAKAKDLPLEAKAKAKDLTPKAKAKAKAKDTISWPRGAKAMSSKTPFLAIAGP